jgi:hypothetical protein
MTTQWRWNAWLLILLIGVLGGYPDAADEFLAAGQCPSGQVDRDEEMDSSPALTVVGAAGIAACARRRVGAERADSKPLHRSTRPDSQADTDQSTGSSSAGIPALLPLRI